MSEVEFTKYDYSVLANGQVELFDSIDDALEYARFIRAKDGNINIKVSMHTDIVGW